MKTLTQHAALACLIGSLVISPIAEAKRVGSGRNVGMSRSSSSYNTSSYNTSRSTGYNNSYSTPSRSSTVPTTTQRSGSGVGKVVAAGVAGAAIGAVAGHAMANNNTGYNGGYNNGYNNGGYNGANGNYAPAPVQQNSGFSWFWLLLLGALGYFLWRKFRGKKAVTSPQTHSMGNTGTMFGGSSPQNTISLNKTMANTANFGAYTSSGNSLPDGTEPAAFLRFARQRFNHVQSMNSASNINEIQRYFTAQMFQDIQRDIVNNDQTAEFTDLNAQLVDQSTEHGQYVASVRFSGMVSEDLNSPAQPFNEIWHFVKPVNSNADWTIAGIQQS